MKIKINLELLAYVFEDLTEKQRIELIKSLILTTPDAQGFLRNVQKLINSPKFKGSID